MINLGVNRNAKTIRIIIDKPCFLPSPRDLLHKSRSSKSGIMPTHDCTIGDLNSIPHCNMYLSMLANLKLKSDLVSYIMKKFQDFACSPQIVSIQIVLDYEGIDSPISISSESCIHVPCLRNQL